MKANPLPERPVAFYGSSSIRLWADLGGDLDEARAVNVGFGGSTLDACVHFFARLVEPLEPAALVVYAGDNDLGDGGSPEEVLARFRGLADRVESLPVAVRLAFISIKPSPARAALRDRICRSNALVREEIEQRTSARFVDVYEAMLDCWGKPRPELFLDDGLHLSRAGYRLWAEIIRAHREWMFPAP